MSKARWFWITGLSLVLASAFARADEWDLGQYGEELVGADAAEAPATEAPAAAPQIASVSKPRAARPAAESAPKQEAPAPVVTAMRSEPAAAPADVVRLEDQASAGVAEDFVVRFGVGATWANPIRLSDDAAKGRMLSDFSFNWAPFGLPGEVGFDMLLGRDSKFIARPNLKFFFAKSRWFSLYLEGACDILSMGGRTEIGGGGGLGMIIGLADYLALEIRGTASVYSMSAAGAAQLFGDSNDADMVAAVETGRELVVLPSASARLMVRF